MEHLIKRYNKLNTIRSKDLAGTQSQRIKKYNRLQEIKNKVNQKILKGA
jgi:enolase